MQEGRWLNKNWVLVNLETGERKSNFFALFPEDDPDARMALSAYAETKGNSPIARFLRGWIKAIRHKLEKQEHI